MGLALFRNMHFNIRKKQRNKENDLVALFIEMMRMCAQVCLTLCDPMDRAHQAPVPMEFLRKEYWSGLLFPTPGDLPDLGIEQNLKQFLNCRWISLPADPSGKL